MDIDEFERTTQPKAKRSKLEPFHAQIFELKRKGYANWQIRDWLAANNVKVSQEAVRKFIKSRDDTTPPTVPTSEKVSTQEDLDKPNKEEKPKTTTGNPFAKANKTDGDIRRNQFEYNPTPDLTKIYGDNNDE
ncbi:MAG: hypothetical protein Q7T91_02095 [Sulfuricurvum sp.]|nr:hypothetical protein [Sulfuricurvum sp.]